MVSVVSATGIRDIDGVLWGWKWDLTSLSFSFPTGTAEYTSYTAINGFSAFNAVQKTAARLDLANVASFTNLTFTETTSSDADLRYAEASSVNYTNNASVATHTGLHTLDTAEANPPELAFAGTAPFSAPYAQGDSWYNPTVYDNPLVGTFAYTAGVMHETGHNLGLKHGHAEQDGHGTTFPTLSTDHNTQEYSVMTYTDFVGDVDPDINSRDLPTTFMQDDIAALQYMYGANYGASAHNGDTTYTWSRTTGQEFIDGAGQPTPNRNFVFMTLWDGGGTDTYDFSNYTTNLNVDLAPGAWTVLDTSTSHRQRANLGDDGSGSGTHFARANIANAQVDPNHPTETASLIENATGGSGDDTISGNSADNLLKGGGGDDILNALEGKDLLDGGAGHDTLKGGGGADTLMGGGGDDILKGEGGDDVLYGGTVLGGLGTDTAFFGGMRASYTITENVAGTDVIGPDGHDTLHDILILTFDDQTIVDDFSRNTSTTGHVAVRGSATGSLTFSGDHDWFAVTLNAGISYTMGEYGSSTADGTLGDPQMQLYNSSNVLLNSDNDTGTGLNALLAFTPTTTGTYYIDAGGFGAATGTYTVRIAFSLTNNDGASDFNGDGISDILWRHNSGLVAEWQMSAGQIHNNLGLASLDASWHFQDTGDFDADGRSDVLWRNDSGQAALWTMDAGQIAANRSVATIGNDWHNQGVGDFDGDGRSDVLWRNDSGQIALWTMDGAQITDNRSVATVGLDWHIEGLSDFGADGRSDVLWRNDSGQVVIWTMDGAQIAGNQSVATVGRDWHVAGTGDFDGDGKGDVLWRNDSGQVALWTMDGAQITANRSVGTVGLDWHIENIGDYNHDGRSDVLWRNDSGQVVMWEMKGAQIASNHTVATIGADWASVSHHYDLI